MAKWDMKTEPADALECIRYLRAKLAVAVEALEAVCESPARRFQRQAARAALAQIKGETK